MPPRHATALSVIGAACLAAAACGTLLPTSARPTPTGPSLDQVIGTSVAATLTAHPAASATRAATSTPEPQATATACQPTVTANVNANIRSAPGTSHDVIGSLRQGQSAHVVATDETATWWYIERGGGHGWIAARVSTAVCIPNDLPVIAY
jgi:endonuclease/exonuclease/phosphatase (EEP) superfamily protein YafD